MSYIEIVKKSKDDYVGEGILLKLTDAGREELEAYRTDHLAPYNWNKGTEEILCNLLEDWLCNGWEMVPPEDIGALTSAPILSDEIERDDNGEIVKVGAVYWFPDYAIICELDVLADNGEVFFPAAKEEVEANG
jgi:hypothetical protein